LLNGEHYSVIGNNKQIAEKGETIVFEINIERGYRAVSFFGDDCVISDNLSFAQTVTFSNVCYNMTAQIETEEIPVVDFEVVCDENMGDIELTSLLGSASKDLYYDCDIIDLVAVPQSGHRFVCWSTDNYIASGGSFYGYDAVLGNIDFATVGKLYANFKDITNTKNTLVYKLKTG